MGIAPEAKTRSDWEPEMSEAAVMDPLWLRFLNFPDHSMLEDLSARLRSTDRYKITPNFELQTSLLVCTLELTK